MQAVWEAKRMDDGDPRPPSGGASEKLRHGSPAGDAPVVLGKRQADRLSRTFGTRPDVYAARKLDHGSLLLRRYENKIVADH